MTQLYIYIPDEEVYTPAVLGRRRRSVLSQNEAEENIRVIVVLLGTSS